MNARTAKRASPKPRRTRSVPESRFGYFCIGCGCCDMAGCPGGCSWRQVLPSLSIGVCSECPAYLPLLKDMSDATARAIYKEKAAKAEEWG